MTAAQKALASKHFGVCSTKPWDKHRWLSLSRVRRYYETGVKTSLGEVLMEYGFPVDAIRNLEDKFDQLRNLDLAGSKAFCRQHFKEIISVFDSYEVDLFIRAIRSI